MDIAVASFPVWIYEVVILCVGTLHSQEANRYALLFNGAGEFSVRKAQNLHAAVWKTSNKLQLAP